MEVTVRCMSLFFFKQRRRERKGERDMGRQRARERMREAGEAHCFYGRVRVCFWAVIASS